MKLTLFRISSLPSEQHQEVNLNITPVMNMFIILIPFLVSMAVFTHLSIIEFSLPPDVSSVTPDNDNKPVPKLTIRIGNDFLGIVLGENLLDSLPVLNGIYPFDSLKIKIALRKSELNYDGEIIVASADKIKFQEVVKVMDICREIGLKKIGLSSAGEGY
ncbi:MAG: biopolymer transporter ExbD [Chitinispirillaceae bacterium]|nr:biopolymer transporter ExbD [Chitinispirillaceae bacterium]